MFRRRDPIMVPGPDGTLMPRKAAKDAWAIYNRTQAREANLRLQDKQRGSRNRGRDMERDQDRKDRDAREGKVAARWTRVAAVLRTFGQRLRNDLPLLFTLATVAISLTVTLSGQWMFYDTLPWPAAFRWLVGPLALLVESGSWTYGVQARWLAENGQPYGAKTRRMWLLALLAAGMNTYHGADAFPDHPEMGLILGGGSVLGPAAWHGYIHLTKIRERAKHRSSAQLRAAIARRINHPVLAWRAWDLRSACGARISEEVAFLMVYRDHFGHLPGQRVQRRVVVSRARVDLGYLLACELLAAGLGAGVWYLTGRVGMGVAVTAAGVVGTAVWALSRHRLSAELSGPLSAESADPDTADSALVPSAEEPATQAPLSADSAPAVALVGGDGSAEETTLTDAEIEAFLTSLDRSNGSADSALSNTQNPSSEGVSGAPTDRPLSARLSAELSGPLSAESADPDTADSALDSAADQRRPSGSRRHRRALRSATNADRIRTYVDHELAGGRALEEITGPEVAKALKIGESTARNLLKTIKNEVGGLQS